MAPTIPTGSLVVLRWVDADTVEPGDIITFRSPVDADLLVTHRVVAVEPADGTPMFATRGDANPDPWLVPGEEDSLVHWFHVPGLGRVFAALGTTTARAVLLVVPLALLGLRWWRQRAARRRRPPPAPSTPPPAG